MTYETTGPESLIENKIMPRKPRNHVPIGEIFLSGQLMGLALKIDTDKLQKYLDGNPPGFNYAKQCRDVLNFVKAITNTES